MRSAATAYASCTTAGMALVLAYGVLLTIAVLVSHRAHTTVLSTSVLFLVAGAALGQIGPSVVDVDISVQAIGEAARVALFTILISDGTQLGAREILAAWRLPGRALLIGLPLTIAVVAVAAHLVLGVSWIASIALGAALSPTDPVLVRSLLDRHVVPRRLRRLLHVESGLNDGLALPVLLVALGHGRGIGETLLDVAGGLVLGAAAGFITLLQRVSWLRITKTYEPLFGVAIALTVFGAARLLGVNELLAAYAAGVGIATLAPDVAHAFQRLADPISEALKLGVLLIFGATATIATDWRALVFAGITLVMARPIALVFALARKKLPRDEWLTAAWFGPKGFATLLYGALILESGMPGAWRLLTIAGLVVAASVIAHSSTDTLVVRHFDRLQARSGTPRASSEDGGDHVSTRR